MKCNQFISMQLSSLYRGSSLWDKILVASSELMTASGPRIRLGPTAQRRSQNFTHQNTYDNFADKVLISAVIIIKFNLRKFINDTQHRAVSLRQPRFLWIGCRLVCKSVFNSTYAIVLYSLQQDKLFAGIKVKITHGGCLTGFLLRVNWSRWVLAVETENGERFVSAARTVHLYWQHSTSHCHKHAVSSVRPCVPQIGSMPSLWRHWAVVMANKWPTGCILLQRCTRNVIITDRATYETSSIILHWTELTARYPNTGCS